jgi:hypothetical protein
MEGGGSMSTVTVPPGGYWTAAEDFVLYGCPELTLAQKMFYIFLKKAVRKAGGILHRSIAWMAKRSRLSVGTIHEAIPAIKKAGLIDADKAPTGNEQNGHATWRIALMDIAEINELFGQEHRWWEDGWEESAPATTNNEPAPAPKPQRPPKQQSAQPTELLRDHLDFEEVRYDAWVSETVVALASRFLDVPMRPDDGDALEHWLDEWQRPSEQLMAATDGLSPQRAWERIDTVMRYMGTPGSPSWWQRSAEEGGRAKKTAITLRHVAKRFSYEWRDFLRHQWYPQQTTVYDGPVVVEEYEEQDCEGGTEGLQAAQFIEEAPVQVEEINGLPNSPEIAPATAQLPGMALDEAHALQQRILAEFPELISDIAAIMDHNGRFVVGLRYGDDQWYDVATERMWDLPADDEWAAIDRAIDYARSRQGVAVSQEDAEQPAVPPVEVTPPQGMTSADVDALIGDLRNEAPEIIFDEPQLVAPEQWTLVIATSDTTGLLLNDIEQWRNPPPLTRQALDMARAYGKALKCVSQKGGAPQNSNGPPGETKKVEVAL